MTGRLRALAAAAALSLAAPASARPQLQAFFQSTLTSQGYQQKVFNKYAKVWRQPAQRPAPGKKTVIRAVLARDGALMSATVGLRSGSKPWDDAALAAVKKASPFGPLPAEFAYPSVEVDFHVSWMK